MQLQQLSHIIEGIYQAAIEPEQWLHVVANIAQGFDSHAGGLFIQNPQTGAFAPIPFMGVADEWVQSYADYYSQCNPAFSDESIFEPGKVFTEQLLNRDDQYYASTEFYNEWMKPQAFNHTAGGVLLINQQNYVNFTLQRDKARGQYTQQELEVLTLLFRHLRRAVEMSSVFSQLNYRMGNLQHLLESQGHGVLVLDKQMNIQDCNERAKQALDADSGLSIRQGKLVAHSGPDQQALERAVELTIEKKALDSSVPIRLNLSAKADQHLIMLPSAQGHRLLVKDVEIILIIKQGQACEEISLEYLQHSYGLNASEARLTRYLLDGFELKVAARHAGVAYETARWYLKSIYEKTGTHRQIELILLLNADPGARLKPSGELVS